MREVNYDERWKVARDLACKINLWPTVENLRHLAAALRRAKAEGERFGLQQGLLIAHIIETGTAAQVIDGINARIAELDARAAQIEALGQEGI